MTGLLVVKSESKSASDSPCGCSRGCCRVIRSKIGRASCRERVKIVVRDGGGKKDIKERWMDMRVDDHPVSIEELILFFFQAEDGIRDRDVTGVQTCALPISMDQPRVAVEGKDDRLARREERVEVGVRQPVRMLAGLLQGHQIEDRKSVV